MAHETQMMRDQSDYDVFLFQHGAVARVIGFVAQALIHSNYAAVKKFLAGQNIIVNHQLKMWGEKPGSFFLMVPFCVSVVSQLATVAPDMIADTL